MDSNINLDTVVVELEFKGKARVTVPKDFDLTTIFEGWDEEYCPIALASDNIYDAIFSKENIEYEEFETTGGEV